MFLRHQAPVGSQSRLFENLAFYAAVMAKIVSEKQILDILQAKYCHLLR